MKILYRSRTNRVIAGICCGIGEYFSVDPTLVRILTVFMALVTAVIPFVLTYLIGWVIIPEKPAE